MVEIIPYTEDDDDSSTWIPLSAPTSDNGAIVPTENTTSNQGNTTEQASDEADEDYSEWQNLSSNLVTANAVQPLLAESAAWVEKRIISHLTTTPQQTEEDGDLSENDEQILWKGADELKDDEKLLFKRKEGDAKPPNRDDRPQEVPRSHASRRPQNQSQSNQQQTPQRTLNTSHDQANYREEAKTKLQQTLLYHPMRELPFCILRHLYREGKHELSLAWEDYTAAHGTTIFAPLTFFIVVTLLGLLLVGTGVIRIATIAVIGAVRLSVDLVRFMIWGAWGMTTQLAWVSLFASVILGVVVWIWMVKKRRASANNFVATKQWGPDISAILSVLVVLASFSVYELVAILYSLQALSLPTTTSDTYNLDSGEECDAHVPVSSTLGSLVAFVMALLVVALACCGVSAFSAYLESDTPSETGSVTALKQDKARTLDEHLARIKRHLNACHTLSVILLVLSAISFLTMRAMYHYIDGEFIAGLGTIGFNLLWIAIGVYLVYWAGEQAINELPESTIDDEDRNLYQRILQNALKEAVIDITTNAVWSNTSGLSGVLSEEDGILRLAVLEWLIDRWATSQQSSSSGEPTSESEHEQSTSPSADTPSSNQSDANNVHASSSANQSRSNAANSHAQPAGANNIDILSSLPSYESLEKVMSRLDADEALIPAIQSYRTWIYSLPPSRNVAITIACWKMCPGMVALMLVLVWSTLMGLKEGFMTLLNSQNLSEQCPVTTSIPGNHIIFFALMLSPLMYLEYLRVRRWWTRVVASLNETEIRDQTETIPDSLAIMLAYDYDEPLNAETASELSPLNKKIIQTWNLLLESIAMLESSIPVVRCATIGVAAANLTNDAATLVDLALEIKNRGLLGGIGMLLVDAFSHHLSEELRRRREESNEDEATDDRDRSTDPDLGGKYTSSLIKSVGHASKLVHNLNQLREENKKASDTTYDSGDGPNASDSEPTSSQTEQAETTTSLVESQDHNSEMSDRFSSSKSLNEGTEPRASEPPLIRDSNVGDGSAYNMLTEKEEHSESIAASIIQDQTRTKSDVTSGENQALSLTGENGVIQEQTRIETINRTDQKEEHQDGGMPMWLGGGLAVVGALVGGLAVAATVKKEDDKKEQRRSSDST